MIGTMEMATGLWTIDHMAPDTLLATGSSGPDSRGALPPLHAGLHEHVLAPLVYGGMPAGMLALDLDDFFARMADAGN